MKHLCAILIIIILSFLNVAKAQESKDFNDPSSPFKPGYTGAIELGFLYGKIENPFNNPATYPSSPTILIFNGYQAYRMFSIGVTTGLDFYENILITPMGLGLRGTILNTRVSPYYSFDTGYGSSFLSGKSGGHETKGGYFVNPVLGLRVRVDQKSAFHFGLGYKQQKVEIDFPEWWGSTVNQKITYRRLSLRMGFMF